MSRRWPRTTQMVHYYKSDAPYFNFAPLTLKQKVLDLYKNCLKNIRNLHGHNLFEERYQIMKLRKRFEENRHLKDFRVVKRLLEDGEQELHDNRGPPQNFTYSPDGVAYGRQYHNWSDLHLDYWHPLEKAMYPYYFARREQRKTEFIQLYESEWGDAGELLGLNEPSGQIDYNQLIQEFVEDARKQEKEHDEQQKLKLEEEKKNSFLGKLLG